MKYLFVLAAFALGGCCATDPQCRAPIVPPPTQTDGGAYAGAVSHAGGLRTGGPGPELRPHEPVWSLGADPWEPPAGGGSTGISSVTAAPEIDPSYGLSAVLLLAGTLAIIRGRR